MQYVTPVLKVKIFINSFPFLIHSWLTLQVEGGRIDHAHHDTVAHRALDEAVAMDAAVKKAVEMTNQKVCCGSVAYHCTICLIHTAQVVCLYVYMCV